MLDFVFVVSVATSTFFPSIVQEVNVIRLCGMMIMTLRFIALVVNMIPVTTQITIMMLLW